jgi:hypothetical protein
MSTTCNVTVSAENDRVQIPQNLNLLEDSYSKSWQPWRNFNNPYPYFSNFETGIVQNTFNPILNTDYNAATLKYLDLHIIYY